MLIKLFLLICYSVINQLNAHHIPESLLVVEDPFIRRSLEWMWGQRQVDYSFQDSTPKAVLALQLGNATTWYTEDNLASLLTVKQMEMEIVLHVWRHHDTPVSPSDLALYSLALSSVCRDPRQFYGRDLIGNLQHHEMLLDLEFALSSLAICSSGAHVRKKQLRRLLDITESNEQLNIETISTVLIALNCIVRDHRNRNLQHYLTKPTKELGKLQLTTGNFGSLKSTALAIQALQTTDPGGHYWNKTNAINFVRSLQNDDGSFEEDKDIQTAIEVILALGPKNLINIKDLNCHTERKDDWSNTAVIDVTLPLNLIINDTTTTTVTSSNKSKDVNNSLYKQINYSEENGDDDNDGIVTVSYTLWVGTNVTVKYTTNITTHINTTFYNVMQLAAQKDDHFSFLSTEWPNGHYVHTLAGYKEEPMSYHYWLLYRLDSMPDVSFPPPNQLVAPGGVDELLVQNGDHYLYWYKKL